MGCWLVVSGCGYNAGADKVRARSDQVRRWVEMGAGGTRVFNTGTLCETYVARKQARLSGMNDAQQSIAPASNLYHNLLSRVKSQEARSMG